MKTILLTIFAILCCAAAAMAFGPNGGKVTILTVNSANQNLINDKEFLIDTPTACQMRLKRNSSVANSGVTAIKLRANTTYGPYEVNTSTPYANFSGCTNASLVRR